MEKEGKKRVCLLVLCGLPASGKTTLTEELHKGNNSVVESRKVIFLAIHYDQLLPSTTEKQLIFERDNESGQKTTSPWKQYREEIVTCIEELLQSLQRTGSCFSSDQKPKTVTDDLWQIFVAMVTTDCYLDKDVCIVIDDNMYYRSMRYGYFQLARKYHVGFCEIYVDCTVEEACVRNKKRRNKVEDDVIISMATKFEKPDTIANRWEKHALTVQVNGDLDIRPVLNLIKESIGDPVQPIAEEDFEAVNQARYVCSTSLLHQADQIIRKLISDHMKTISSEGTYSKQALKELSAMLQRARTTILDNLRAGLLPLPQKIQETVADAAKDKTNPLYLFLQHVFQAELTGVT